MNHREASLQFLQNTGLIPVKVRPGQKDPFPEWDPQRAESLDHSLTLKQLKEDTSLNLGALFTGKYIDVDVDTKNQLLHAALDYFLPKTQYIWGRKSKRKGHRVYVLHEDFDRAKWSFLTRYLKGLVAGSIIDDSLSVEVRGGEAKNGMFAVLPGSFHSGELIEWQEGIDPSMGGAHIEDDLLMRCIRLAVMSAVIASVWQEGTRNDISLALSGLMWRIRTATLSAHGLGPDDEVPPDQFILTIDDATAIFKCVMRIAGDDPEDERSRLLNLHNTWRKLDGDSSARVSGGKVLGEMLGDAGPKIVKAAYRLLSDNDAAEQVEKLAEQFVMWYGMGVVIDLEMVNSSRTVPWMNYVQAKFSLGNKKITIGENRVPVVDLIFNSNIVDRVRGLTFDPSCDELVVKTNEGLMVNQWSGFACKPAEQRVSGDEVQPFLDYIMKIVCNNDGEAFIWVMSWIADMLQEPAKKPGTSLVLVGVQGAGKSFLGERVIGPMFGGEHYALLDSVSRLTNNFNTSIDNKVFIQCDESIHSYQKEVANRLKGIITGHTIEIEPKGINSYRKPNHLHILFTSNSETAALFIDPSPYERRYTVLKVNTDFATNVKYWEEMHQWIELFRPKVMRYLLDYKYEKKSIMRPLSTKAKSDMQRIGLEPEVAWILSRMQSGFLLSTQSHTNWFDSFHTDHINDQDKKRNSLIRHEWPNRVTAKALEEDFKSFVRQHGRPIYSGSVMTTIRKIMPPQSINEMGQITTKVVDPRSGQESKERVRVLSVPKIEDIYAHLREVFGPMIEDHVRKDLTELGDGGQDNEKEF